jgi:hypothetical protein
MKIRNLAATLLTVTLSLGVSQAVQADPNPDPPGKPDPQECTVTLHILLPEDHACASKLFAVWEAIDELPDIGNNPGRDRLNLQSKVCAADNKLHVDPPKTEDAIEDRRSAKDKHH